MDLDGQDVCDFCRCHLVLLAKAEEVRSLTIKARDISDESRTYVWHPGMPRLEQQDEASPPSGGRIVIRGHILSPDGSLRRLYIADPSESVVRSSLQACRDRRCVVKIEGPAGRRNDYPTPTLLGEEGRYIVTLAELDEEGNVDTRLFDNLYPIYDADFPYMALVHGMTFPATAVVTDFDLVLRAFQEFTRTGSVSHDLMS